MHLTVYFNNKPLILCTEISDEIQSILQQRKTIFKEQPDKETIESTLSEMPQPGVQAGVMLHSDLNGMYEAIKHRFDFIQAAGGLVYTNDKECLLIFRRGKWDLPKGKLDVGESLETCAVREVQEETGIGHINLEKPLCTTYHTYDQDGKHYLKESHWYIMKTALKEELSPQTEEDIQECKWVPIDQLSPYMDKMHRSVIDVLKVGIKALRETKSL